MPPKVIEVEFLFIFLLTKTEQYETLSCYSKGENEIPNPNERKNHIKLLRANIDII